MKVIKMANRSSMINVSNLANTAPVFGLNFFAGTKLELIKILAARLDKDQAGRSGQRVTPLVIFTPNPEQVMLAQKSSPFRQDLLQAELLLPDGIGVVKASHWFGILTKIRRQNLPAVAERIAGIEVVQDLLAAYPLQQFLVIGGRGYQATKAAAKPVKSNAGAKASGGSSGPGISGSTVKLKIKNCEVTWFTGYQTAGLNMAEDEKKIRQVLRQLKPAVVFVAFGAPDQERWIIDHLQLLQEEDVSLVMAVGGSFDVLTGKLRRAPGWWRKVGLEWLFRLLQQPQRWRRQLSLVAFIWLTLREGGRVLFKKNPGGVR